MRFNPKIPTFLAIGTFILLIIVLFISLMNINTFMASESKCESGFAMINRCGCFPDDNYARLFGYKSILDFNNKNGNR